MGWSEIMIYIIAVATVLFIGIRFFYSLRDEGEIPMIECGQDGAIGTMQIQSDYAGMTTTGAGTIAVLADGIGRDEFGRKCSKIGVKSILSIFNEYMNIDQPLYFFKRSFHYADQQIKKVLDDRPGGASIACAFIKQNELHYAVAGDVEIMMYRDGELIPLTEGQTIDVLAKDAYLRGKITKQKAVAALKEKRVWNYAGQEEFRDLEFYDVPVKLKVQDRIIIYTKGIRDIVTEQDLKSSLGNFKITAGQAASNIIARFYESKAEEKDNGTAVIIQINRTEG